MHTESKKITWHQDQCVQELQLVHHAERADIEFPLFAALLSMESSVKCFELLAAHLVEVRDFVGDIFHFGVTVVVTGDVTVRVMCTASAVEVVCTVTVGDILRAAPASTRTVAVVVVGRRAGVIVERQENVDIVVVRLARFQELLVGTADSAFVDAPHDIAGSGVSPIVQDGPTRVLPQQRELFC